MYMYLYFSTSVKERAVVRYSYTADNEDELSLNENEVITVLNKDLDDPGWWKGEVNGKIGLFPDNFVELLPIEEVSICPHLYLLGSYGYAGFLSLHPLVWLCC